MTKQNDAERQSDAGRDDTSRFFFVFGVVLVTCGVLAAFLGISGGVFTFVAGSVFFSNMPFPGGMTGFAVLNQMQGGIMIAFGLISVHACVAGGGLISRKSWGRANAMIWAVSALIYLAVERTLHYAYIVPKTEAIFQNIFNATGISLPVGQGGNMMMATNPVTIVLAAILPVFTLILIPAKVSARK